MSKNYKMTGFAKFFIFLLIAAPLSFVGASYYNGQDPFETFKKWDLFNKKDTKTVKSDTKVYENTSLEKELEIKELEIKQQNEKIAKLEELIESQKKEIAQLKNLNTKK